MTVYDKAARERAADLFDQGRGFQSVSEIICVPAEAVRQWQATYRAVGRNGLLSMGSNKEYDFETRVAAARAVVEGGRSRTEAMEEFGIASTSTLKTWCRLYRKGGAEALRPVFGNNFLSTVAVPF